MGWYKPGSTQPIPIGEFAPDKNVLEPGILLDCVGALPTLSGFQPMNNNIQVSPALGGRPAGSHLAFFNAENTQLYAAYDNGTGLSFVVLDTNLGVWVPHTGPTAFPVVPVRFAQYGDDVLVVGNFNTNGVWRAPNSPDFSVITGSPANATVIVVINNQVMVFVGNAWFTSAAGDDTDWTLSLATRADTGTLTDSPGPVVAAAPLYRQAIVFKKNVTYLATQSFPAAFDFQLISTTTGTWGQGCVITMPDAVAFLGLDDFYITTGYTPQRIPNNMKQWFFRTVNPNYLDRTLGWLDLNNSVLYWHFVSNQAPDPPTCDRFVSYNVRSKRWCNGRLDVSSIPYLATETNVVPNPGRPQNFIDGQFKANIFTGTPGNMVLTTGYYGTPGRLSQLMRVLPLYDRAPCEQTLTPLCTDVLGQADKQSEPATLEVDGWFYTRQYERYHKLIMGMKGDCELTALVPELRAGGLWGYGNPPPCPEQGPSVEVHIQPLLAQLTFDVSATVTAGAQNAIMQAVPAIAFSVPPCSAAQPGPQELGIVCCYNVDAGWGNVGTNHHGMFAHADSDGKIWFTISTNTGFGAGPYPPDAGTQWHLLQGLADCSFSELTGASLIPLPGYTLSFAGQTPQAGTCGKSDEKIYTLQGTINPGLSGAGGNQANVWIPFTNTYGATPLVWTQNNNPNPNAWTKYGNQIFSCANNGGAGTQWLIRWPLTAGVNGTFEDASVQLGSISGISASMDKESIIAMHATANYVWLLVSGIVAKPFTNSPTTGMRIYKLDKSFNYVADYVLNSDPNFPTPWGFHVFSETDLIFLIQNNALQDYKVGFYDQSMGTSTVIDSSVSSLCTEAGNGTGPPGQSGFEYSKNYFYLSYSGYGLGVTNVLKIGPLVCPNNPNEPWEN